MALKISKNIGLTDVVSDVNPISTEHPISGSAQTVQLWLFNDNAAKRYETITIYPIDSSIGDGDQSTWIELSADNVTYQAAGAVLNMANISTANSGVTFYARITTPSVADSQNRTDIKLQVNGKEYAV